MKKEEFTNFIQYTGSKRFQKLLYEFFYWDVKKLDKNMSYLIDSDFEDIETLVNNLNMTYFYLAF